MQGSKMHLASVIYGHEAFSRSAAPMLRAEVESSGNSDVPPETTRAETALSGVYETKPSLGLLVDNAPFNGGVEVLHVQEGLPGHAAGLREMDIIESVMYTRVSLVWGTVTCG